MRERIYLDTCVLNRPTDDQTQERIQAETLAIAQILELAAKGDVDWIAGTPVLVEIGRNPNLQRRQDALNLLLLATQLVRPTQKARDNSEELAAQGYGAFDALHLALAAESGATVLLTVDDRFLRHAATRPAGAIPPVENPLDWWRRRQPWLIKR